MNMSVPRVSAIMPVYNSRATIRSAIRSVINQSFQNWELIVVDDGSTDDSADIARALASVDSRIRVYSVARGGRGSARNHCLEHVRGELVAICDADDLSSSNRFELQVEAADTTGCDVVACSRGISFSSDLRHRDAVILPGSDHDIKAVFSRNRMPLLFASCLIRTSVFNRFGQFDAELHRNQDYGFFRRCYTSLSFTVVDEPLLMFRRASVSTGYRHVRESNFFRQLATLRAEGRAVTASQLKSSFSGQFQLTVLSPLQYGWHALQRRVLRRGVRHLSDLEQRILAATAVATEDVAMHAL